MDADMYVARWTIIIRDDEQPGQPGKAPAWKQAMEPGATFNIAKDAFGDYWYLPGPGLKAPMDQPRKLVATTETHGAFEVGALLPGTLCAELGSDGGRLHFSINLVDGKHRMINLSQTHGGVHGFG